MKSRFPREHCLSVGQSVISLLNPFVDRIAICGSVRRMEATCSDIEILFVPKVQTVPDGLFDTVQKDLADEYLESLFKSGLIGKRLNTAGHVAAWGPKNKLAVHTVSGIPIDFFSTSVESWWVSLVIRTGSKETNLRLTTGAQKLNRTLHAYGSGVESRATGELFVATSEEDVFKLCNVPYLEPRKR